MAAKYSVEKIKSHKIMSIWQILFIPFYCVNVIHHQMIHFLVKNYNIFMTGFIRKRLSLSDHTDQENFLLNFLQKGFTHKSNEKFKPKVPHTCLLAFP